VMPSSALAAPIHPDRIAFLPHGASSLCFGVAPLAWPRAACGGVSAAHDGSGSTRVGHTFHLISEQSRGHIFHLISEQSTGGLPLRPRSKPMCRTAAPPAGVFLVRGGGVLSAAACVIR